MLVSVKEGRWRYYSWPRNSAKRVVSMALEWIRVHAGSDHLLEADLARRQVALHHCMAPGPRTDRPKVIFLCTHNSCRSQMAEALSKHHAGDRFEVYSAGIDISSQESKTVLQYPGKMHFDHLMTVCPLAERHIPVFPGVTERPHWPEEDPSVVDGSPAEKKAVFRSIRDSLKRWALRLFPPFPLRRN